MLGIVSSNKRHKLGMTINVSTVLIARPDMIAHAMGGHNVESDNASGNNPRMVVVVVNRMGAVRC